jgi:pimeloyl-ACP methyl ester carboxylesterase
MGNQIRLWMRACVVTAIFGFTGLANAQQQEGFNATDKLAPEFELTPFYEANLDFAGKKPGDVIKREAIPAPAGAVAWRVMYVSRTWDDRLVPVTGIIVAPKEPSPSGRPIITWEHGTTGTARVSAPSLAPNPAQELVERSATAPIDYGVPYLNDFLMRGFVVAATDYYGLGGPGVHQYFVGATAARNGLDIARAARNLQDVGAGSEVITFGWSQGGHAALFTAEEQPGYAAELIHRGAVAIAPGTTAGFKYVNIPHIYLTMRSYESAYYAPLTGLTPQGRQLLDKAAEVSVTGVFQESARLSGPFFTGDWDPTMQKALDMNVPGQRKSPTPILVIQGTKDDVVLPEWTRQLLPRALKSGNQIKVSWYEGATHRSAVDKAKPDILRWIDDRLAGKPAPTDTLPQ